MKIAEFQKYLFHSPFPIENVEIDIYFTTKDYKRVFYPDISVVGINRGKIGYYSNDPDSYRFKSEEEEPYEEAFRIVKAKSSQHPIQHPDI